MLYKHYFKSFNSKPHIHANHKTGKLCCNNHHWGKTSLMNVIYNQCQSWKEKKGERITLKIYMLCIFILNIYIYFFNL